LTSLPFALVFHRALNRSNQAGSPILLAGIFMPGG
jgi:hypothetical protein